MPSPDLDDPRVYLDPEDVTTVQTAGVAFARSLAGAPSHAFLVALSEQRDMIEAAVQRAGYGERRARLATSEFSFAAVGEWERIEPAFSGSQWGTA